MRRAFVTKVIVVIINVFWLYIWLPGLFDDLRSARTPRPEDVITVIALLFGTILELFSVRAARFVNIGFYLLYSFVPIVFYFRNKADVHAALGIPLITVPYIAVSVINFYMYRSLKLIHEASS